MQFIVLILNWLVINVSLAGWVLLTPHGDSTHVHGCTDVASGLVLCHGQPLLEGLYLGEGVDESRHQDKNSDDSQCCQDGRVVKFDTRFSIILAPIGVCVDIEYVCGVIAERSGIWNQLHLDLSCRIEKGFDHLDELHKLWIVKSHCCLSLNTRK